MSSSSPRTMRRNAAISGSTSSKSNSKVFGRTLPSLSAWLLPWLRVTVFSFTLHRGLRDARARGQRLLRGILERLVRREHHGGRAHLVVRRVDAGWRNTFLHQRLGRAHQPMARHDDAVV